MLGFSALSVTPLSDISISTIVDANAAVLGRALVTAAGTRQAFGIASVLGRAVVTASEGPIRGNAAITGKATVTALGGYSRSAVAAVLGRSTVTASGVKLLLNSSDAKPILLIPKNLGEI